MKTSLLLGSSLALALVAPATAAEPVPTQPCEPYDLTILGPSGAHKDVETPGSPLYRSAVTYRFVLDLSGSPAVLAAKSATVKFDLSWDDSVSDFDMMVTDNEGAEHNSRATNILYGTFEAVTLTGNPHCAQLGVTIRNFSGLPNTPIDLDITVTDLE